MIIITGCDNTGKTSLIEHLSERFNIPIAKRFNPLPPKTPDEYDRWFCWVREQLEINTEFIHDRFFIDEFVYGPVKRGKYGCTIEQMALLSQMLLIRQPLYIYTEIPLTDLLRTFHEREQYIKKEDVAKILHQFRLVNSSWPVSQLTNKSRFSYKNDPNYNRIDLVVGNYL